jgi:hypothetical protein
MNRAMAIVTGLACMALCSMTLGQPAPRPANAPPEIPEAAQKLESTVLPDLSIAGSTDLESTIGQLRDKVPGFNVVIVRGEGVPNDYPTLPSMQTKNVTVGQFLQFLKTSFAGVNTQRIDGPNGPLYVIKINASPGVPGVPMYPTQMPGPYGGAVPIPAAPAPDQPQVRVYYLQDILASLDPSGNDQQQTLNDVASLISQALDEVDEKVPSEIKIHAATCTLIFKGGPRKMAVLDQLLQTLSPKTDPEKKKLDDELVRLKADLKLQLESADRRIQQREQELDEANKELAALRVKLLSGNATTRP